MDNRRATTRQRVFKTATITFNRAAGISCTVRNISTSGACLDVASPIGIPPSFDLVLDSEQRRRPCRVIWQSDRRIGVAFT